MEKLREFLNSLSVAEQEAFAKNCGTTLGYLRKALSARSRLGEKLVIAIDRESQGAVPCEDILPDVDWAHLRGSASSTSVRM